jgi:hypothetical protein
MSTQIFQRRCFRLGLGAVLALAAAGCGPQFDPPSKLQSLRILAVKKDDPYLRPTSTGASDPSAGYEPDNTAHMTLAIEDARLKQDKLGPDKKGPLLQKLWFAGCNNPPMDNYFSCLLSVWLSFKAFKEFRTEPLDDGQSWSINDIPMTLASLQRVTTFLEELFPGYSQSADGTQLIGPNGETVETQALYEQAAALNVGAGDTFDYTVPASIIAQHAPSTDKDMPPYGLSMVFLAVCDGELGLSPEWQENVDPLTVMTDATRGFPLTCYERGTAKERGPDNFMVSYSNLYVYEELKNKNPVIRGFKFDGEDVVESAVCIGEDCVGAPPSTCDEVPLAPRVKLCKLGGASDCQQYTVTPVLDEKGENGNSEIDDIASLIGGGNAQLHEQMWIRYYADMGDIKNDAKRLQDATEGWFGEHATKWTVPSEGEGIAHIWSVVYDNRGGVDWARISVCVEK